MGWFGRKKDPQDANEVLRRYNEEQAARVSGMLGGTGEQASPSDASAALASTVPTTTGGTAEFAVEDVFTITGRGLVATGTARTGTLRVDDAVEVLRGGARTGTARITGIEMFRKRAHEVEAGTMAGLLLKGTADVARGDTIRVVPSA